MLFLGDPRQKLVRPFWNKLREEPLEIQVHCYLKPPGKIVEKFEVPDLVEILGQKVPNFELLLGYYTLVFDGGFLKIAHCAS